ASLCCKLIIITVQVTEKLVGKTSTLPSDLDVALYTPIMFTLQILPYTSEYQNLSCSLAIRYMRDCDEMFQTGHTKSGLYIIQPENTRKLVVQCYMDGCNGWTVIQRNIQDTEITWSETWTTYKYGFGNLEGEHWLGNEYISLITEQKWYKVRINLVDASGNHKYAEYDSFALRNEKGNYRLMLGSYEGNAGDALSSSLTKNMHDNMQFSCKDKDNDRSTLENCASVHGGGWWYDSSGTLQSAHKIYGSCIHRSGFHMAATEPPTFTQLGDNCNT
uniref:Fibrinogen C-terminal domain-containing protein n=1 Tax=Varanus komodoensis TaxID=61221 RepID=A0A8D2J4M0_VARKO